MKKKGQRRLVLTEEDYTSKLSSIVARDFFPDVSKLERQNALLDRRLEGDAAGAIAIRRASRRLIENEELAAAQREQGDFETVQLGTDAINTQASRRVCAERLIRKRPRPLVEESITGFVARATNEDDDEFDSNLRRESKANRKRMSEVYGPQNNNAGKTENVNNLLLEMASDDFAPESNNIDFKEPKMRNSLFFNITPINTPFQSKCNTKHEAYLLTDSMASSDTSKNGILMPPPSKQQTAEIVSTRSNDNKNPTHLLKSDLVEYIPKHKLQKKIEPSATRFPSEDSLLVMSRTECNMNGIMMEEIESDSDTDCISYTTGTSTDLDVPLKPLEEERRLFQDKERSKRQPYDTIATQNSSRAVSASMRFSVKPNSLSGSDYTIKSSLPSGFHISSKTKRECAATTAELSLARRAKLASSSSSFLSSKSNKRRQMAKVGRLSSLSPAALSLLKKSKSTGQRSGGAFVSALRTSYTPQLNSSSSSFPSQSRKGRKTRQRDHAYNSTPQI